MSNATYAFILNSSSNWKQSTVDDWEWNIVELEGNEKVIGHHRIDGMTYKVLQVGNQIVAVTK